jgi:hypothetical protein
MLVRMTQVVDDRLRGQCRSSGLGPRFAQHACSDRAPDGEQHNHQQYEPDANGFH